MTVSNYVARIVQIPDHGIRFEPAESTIPPKQPTEVNLLGMAIALALGAAGYWHHPEPRDPELQTLTALLTGEAVMPWLPATDATTDAYIVCELTPRRPPMRGPAAPAVKHNSQTAAVGWKPTSIGGLSRRPRCTTASPAAN